MPVASVKLPSSGAAHFQIVGKKIYIACQDKLLALDATRPEAITLLGECPVNSDLTVGAFMVREPYAYLFAGQQGHVLCQFDVSDPGKMTLVKTHANAWWHSHLVARPGGFVCYSDNGQAEYALAADGSPRALQLKQQLIIGRDADYLPDSQGALRRRDADAAAVFDGSSRCFQTADDVVVGDGLACAIGRGLTRTRSTSCSRNWPPPVPKPGTRPRKCWAMPCQTSASISGSA